ncbi:MAG: DUF4238 domain-containing protein [Armatimonadota bacterium]|nr:DUF4238 domain-containing protein [Armatimonadota bacterium]
MAKQARRNHFVSQFYLGGFTDTGDKYGKFWVFDLQDDGCSRIGTPVNEAVRKDFNRINAPGIDQNIVEDLLGQIESNAAPIIRRMAQNHTLPEGDDFVNLIYFVAGQAGRTLHFRQKLTTYNELDSKRYLRSKVATREEWENTLEQARRNGFVESTTVTYEQMKRFVDRDNYRIDVPQNRLILDFLDHFEPFARDLSVLNWSLVVKRDGAGYFICSDNPVAIFPTVEIPRRPSGSRLQCRPQIMMPLNTDLALFISDKLLPKVLYANCSKVSELNTNTADVATRHLYSLKPDFMWRRDDGTIGGSCEYTLTRDSRLARAPRAITLEEAFFSEPKSVLPPAQDPA